MVDDHMNEEAAGESQKGGDSKRRKRGGVISQNKSNSATTGATTQDADTAPAPERGCDSVEGYKANRGIINGAAAARYPTSSKEKDEIDLTGLSSDDDTTGSWSSSSGSGSGSSSTSGEEEETDANPSDAQEMTPPSIEWEYHNPGVGDETYLGLAGGTSSVTSNRTGYPMDESFPPSSRAATDTVIVDCYMRSDWDESDEEDYEERNRIADREAQIAYDAAHGAGDSDSFNETNMDEQFSASNDRDAVAAAEIDSETERPVEPPEMWKYETVVVFWPEWEGWKAVWEIFNAEEMELFSVTFAAGGRTGSCCIRCISGYRRDVISTQWKFSDGRRRRKAAHTVENHSARNSARIKKPHGNNGPAASARSRTIVSSNTSLSSVVSTNRRSLKGSRVKRKKAMPCSGGVKKTRKRASSDSASLVSPEASLRWQQQHRLQNEKTCSDDIEGAMASSSRSEDSNSNDDGGGQDLQPIDPNEIFDLGRGKNIQVYWPEHMDIEWGWDLVDWSKVSLYTVEFDDNNKRNSGTCTIEYLDVVYKRGAFVTNWRLTERTGRGKRSCESQGTRNTNSLSQVVAKKRARTMKPRTTDGSRKPDKRHYIEKQLDDKNISKEEIHKFLPKEDILHSCVWVKCKASRKNSTGNEEGIRHHPALVISPYDINSKSKVLDEWINKVVSAKTTGKAFDYVVIYWYSMLYSRSERSHADFIAFDVVKTSDLINCKEGFDCNYHRPPQIEEKKAKGDVLSNMEDNFERGVKIMQKDITLDKGARGGPMFFPHLREKEGEIAKRHMARREKERAQRAAEKEARRRDRHGKNDLVYSVSGKMKSLELCSGQGGISFGLESKGFATATLDYATNAHSNLTLAEYEERIESGRIRHHPHLDTTFDYAWFAPECKTWSNAASKMTYRTLTFIDGIPDSITESAALEAVKDVVHGIEILLEHLERNPNLLITIENPDGFLQHHPVSKRFERDLGLKKLKVSYCKFESGDGKSPRKNTILWTNCESMIRNFGNEAYWCRNDCGSLIKGTKKHYVRAQDFSDRCSAYPQPFIDTVTDLIYTDVAKKRQELEY